eukprot:Skav228573  [mRNA]  locus=scaffold1368:98412:103832:- [translate_table: standard]
MLQQKLTCDAFAGSPSRPSPSYDPTLAVHDVDISRADKHNHDPYCGCRIGEAAHPGPLVDTMTVRLGLLNPTSMKDKFDYFRDLQCHILAMSENSATTTMQHHMNTTFRRAGYTQVWSPPVPPHFTHQREEASLRGSASGVSCHSQFSIRPTRIPLTPGLDPTRIVSCVVQIGHWELHIVVVYGYPASHPQSKLRTSRLIAEAMRLDALVGIPCLILGDFNHPPASLNPCLAMQQQGYQPLGELYHRLYHTDMPPTCRETTHNDQAMVHPSLVEYVRAVHVDKSKFLHDHDPVIITLALPITIPPRYQWRLPKPWTPFEPSPAEIGSHFEQLVVAKPYHSRTSQATIGATSHDRQDAAFPDDMSTDTSAATEPETSESPAFAHHLTWWSHLCEQAVDQALVTQHHADQQRHPQKSLPRNARGRCCSRKLVRLQTARTIKLACQGQYDPAAETASFNTMKWIKQTRRVQSLRNLRNKHPDSPAPEQLQQEWQCILRAKGFGNFARWCAYQPELSHCPLQCPDATFLNDLAQLLRFHTDDKIAMEQKHRRTMARYHKYYDEHSDHLRRTVRAIKGNAHPPLQVVHYDITSPASLTAQDHGMLEVLLSDQIAFRPLQPAAYSGHPCVVQYQEGHKLVAMLEDADTMVPSQGEVKQPCISQQDEVIHHQLHEFWNQFWNRDSSEELQDQTLWTTFEDMIRTFPDLPPVHLHVDDPEPWMAAAKHLKSNTARGHDGWWADELSPPPRQCFEALAEVITHNMHEPVLPSYGNHAITLPLCKKTTSERANDTRPITLLPVIYRLWGRVVTQQVLAQWAPLINPNVVGFLPGRSPQRYMLKLQHDLERLHMHDPNAHIGWQGLTLDLVKCFNMFPRLPAKIALQKAGVPSAFIDQWYHMLNSQTRWWKINHGMYHSGLTTTGTPEGDSWSVLCCIALARLWIECVQTESVDPYSYADNWAWKSTSTPSNLATLDHTKAYCDALRLRIDWNKTWVWTCQRPVSPTWTEEVHAHCPSPHPVQTVHVARELGYTVNYNKVHSRSTQKDRHDQALDYIRKSAQPTLSLDSRARLCAYAVTKALWGTESYVVGQSWFTALRSAIAKTLIIDKSHSNSHLACALLSKHLEDPELYHLKQCIRSCRNMIIYQPEQYRQTFFRMVAHHNRKHTSVWGPAGALAWNLGKLGWNLRSDGLIETDTTVSFHLTDCSLKCLMRYLDHAWMKHLVQCELQRPEWTQLPVPDREATLSCLNTTAHPQTIAQFLTGASMLARQVQHVPAAQAYYDTDKCALCGEEDTYEHRALQCTSLAHVRSRYPDLCELMADLNVCHVNLPVVYEDPHYDFNVCYFQHRPAPSLSPDMLDLLGTLEQQHGTVTCYTDGSCDHPNQPVSRRATYAVVVDTMMPDSLKDHAIDRFVATGTIPDAFQVCLLGEVAGTQSIPRAELQAIINIASTALNVHAWTDSAYSLDMIELVRCTPDVRFLHSLPNYDLLLQLWNCVRRPTFTAGKVPAHALNPASDPQVLTWRKLGNEAADRAAKGFLQHVHRTYPLELSPLRRQQDIKRCHLWYDYLHELQVERAKLFQQQDSTAPIGDDNLTWEDQFLLLQHWTPEPSVQYVTPVDADEVLDNYVWGSQYGDLLLRWLATLHWPSTLDACDPCGLGVTWYELLMSFQYSTQYGTVINTGTQHAGFQPTRIEPNHPDIPWSKQVTSFEKALSCLQGWFDDPLYPSERHMSSAFRLLGGTHAKHGLKYRPMYPYQERIVQDLHRHLERLQLNPNTSGGPTIPELEPWITWRHFPQDQLDSQAGWSVRINRARRAHRR